jgi:hypothetical protein
VKGGEKTDTMLVDQNAHGTTLGRHEEVAPRGDLVTIAERAAQVIPAGSQALAKLCTEMGGLRVIDSTVPWTGGRRATLNSHGIWLRS